VSGDGGNERMWQAMDTILRRSVGRRGAVLSALAGTAFSVAGGGMARARGPSVRPEGARSRSGAGTKRLDLVVPHTGEAFSDVFAEDGHYDSRGLVELNRLLRDYRTGEVKAIDPALFDVLARIQSQLGQKLRVLSGFRSAETNRLMHMAGFDVAEHSLHIAAKAIDFMVPGIAPDRLGALCRQCGAGGLGIYRSGFVHVDTGMERNWTGA
jgi:uncharacterized protein YcbK (DUF882 family)